MARPPLTRPDLTSRTLIREPLVAALPASHPLAHLGQPVEINDLHGIEFLMYDPIEAHYFFELLSSVFHDASVAPVIVQHLSQIHSILALVHLGWGVAVVPESASKMHYDNVVYRPLTLTRPAQVELDLVWRINDENPVLTRLLPVLSAD
jgi:DNA-binding transcriptional LysR family regulator